MNWFYYATVINGLLGYVWWRGTYVAAALFAQTPLDPGWASALGNGGVAVALLFQTAAYVWVLKWILEQHSIQIANLNKANTDAQVERDRQWRKTIERLEKRNELINKDSNIATLECVAMLSRMLPLAESAARLAGLSAEESPDKSIIVTRKRVEKNIEDLQREKKQLALDSEDSSPDAK